MQSERSKKTASSSIDSLNTLLRGELSAVETYKQAMERLGDDFGTRNELAECLAAHEDRVQRLRTLVVSLGGTPSTSSGPWGTFAKMVEGTAKALGRKAAISALEEGEDHGLEEYREEVEKLDTTTRQTVMSELLPGQQETHDRLSRLERTFSS